MPYKELKQKVQIMMWGNLFYLFTSLYFVETGKPSLAHPGSTKFQ